MHKILAASTTALLLVTTAPAFGDVQIPQISLSGATALNLHLFRNKIRNLDGGTGRGHRLAIESSELNIEAEGQAEEFDYGVKIELSTQSNEENSISENRLKIKGDWGTFYGGNTCGIESKSAQGGFRIMGATGGFDGKMTRTYLPATGTSISVSMAGDTSSRTKVFYYTPRFQG
ncbi:porin, partial [Alphaproteobacteria bacterium]|nr:porin [Alphaproteobacteria bacterium]